MLSVTIISSQILYCDSHFGELLNQVDRFCCVAYKTIKLFDKDDIAFLHFELQQA